MRSSFILKWTFEICLDITGPLMSSYVLQLISEIFLYTKRNPEVFLYIKSNSEIFLYATIDL